MITKSTEKLKELIKEHPDYPIAVLVGEEANSGDYSWMYCSDVSFSIERILDREVPWSECIQTKDDFEEGIEEWLWDAMTCESGNPSPLSYVKGTKPTEEEFQNRLKEEIKKYDPYWKDVIAIYVTN